MTTIFTSKLPAFQNWRPYFGNAGILKLFLPDYVLIRNVIWMRMKGELIYDDHQMIMISSYDGADERIEGGASILNAM